MLTREGNKDWNDGFLDGQKGVDHVSRNDDYDNGYAEGYATGEIQSANQEWFQRRENKV